jgi:predicted ribosome quality control (RQC) complex YloA/Tae2 family protein
MGELILSYQGQVGLGDRELEAYDYDGSLIKIPLDPEKSAVENANAFFDKAKRSKARARLVGDQLARQKGDLDAVRALISALQAATRLSEVEDAEADATKRRWLIAQRAPTEKEDRPFQGHRIREMLGPSGWTVLVGENSEANDYLTLRVAKPDDWWFHVRGAVSAHVVIPTRRQPDRVPREVMEFAAKLAVKHSGQKHASFVPVDYTLKRYVRKVRGAPAGTVLYTHEKTLHVDVNA